MHRSLAGRSLALSVAVAGLLSAGCFAVGRIAPAQRLVSLLDWQPALALTEPWRWWTAGLVHYSALHLVANLAGAALVAAFALAARVSPGSAAAWLAACAATHLGLLMEPRLLHYGGLSGVLHAGVALVAVQLIARPTPIAHRWVGAAVLAGLALKVLLEEPWNGPLQHRAGWDIEIAPVAHAMGLVSGAVAGLTTIARDHARSKRSVRP